jgi:hypothetical protein
MHPGVSTNLDLLGSQRSGILALVVCVRNGLVSWNVHIDRGSMQSVQHHMIYSPERNKLSHNDLSCLHIIYLNTMLSERTHNTLTLLAADSAALCL